MAKTLAFVLMEAPHDSANTTTALRLIDAALRKGHNVHVMAYEGAIPNRFATGPADWIAALIRTAAPKGLTLDWVRCSLKSEGSDADDAQIAGTRRVAPAEDFKARVATADNVLVIPCR